MSVEVPRFPYWVFDLDGTLTVPMHDFASKAQELGLPKGIPMLEAAEQASPSERKRILGAVESWEKELAESAQVAPGAVALLRELHRRGSTLGILTRNTKGIALRTLQVIGLGRFFDPDAVLGREDAAPKPDSQGIIKLLNHWEAPPQETIMVGDYLFDLQAGRGAGVSTLWAKPIDAKGDYTPWADFVVSNLQDLNLVGSD